MTGNAISPSPSVKFGSGHPSEPVVEFIQRHAGVQKVPSPKLTLFLKRDFLDPEL